MRLFARYFTAALLAVAMLALSLGIGTRPAAAAPALLPRVGSVSVAAQVGSLTFGTSSSVTYTVTVTRATNQTLTANLSISGLPAGATPSFSPSSLNWSAGGTTRTSTLTITTAAATPSTAPTGSPFTVTATRSGNGNGGDNASRTGTLTIAKASQTISFAALPNKTLGAAPFSVSATASSGLAVSLGAAPASVCTLSGGTITLVGLGTCTVTASQAGNANVSGATSVVRSFDVLAAAASGCSLSGTVRTCSLWAKGGTISLPGNPSIPVWSYTDSASGLPGAVGPTLVANAGETLTINLTNELGEATSLQIMGLGGAADLAGASASGGTASYSFANLPAGTYLYQAGIRTGSGPRQIAMGMAGALVVHEAGSTAYGHAYDDEAVLVYSEIDPAFNSDPANFVLQRFNPVYLLINGQLYPNADDVATTVGNRVLLRHVNAGIRFHSLGVLGLRQTVIADDGNPLPISSSLFAKTLGAGQTMDSL
ncbi:MAG: multicopper oxidase domain-containing protein, partial [Oscillochloris sp.]|nr:multicopper oxidase domain-containing protein [Oscillochloris sp.]